MFIFYLFILRHIAAAAIRFPFSPPPAFLATSANFLPGFPISLPFLAALVTDDFFFFVNPLEGFPPFA